jgi:hypothetical protein
MELQRLRAPSAGRLVPEEGHLSLLVSSYDRVLDGLLESGS